MSRQIENEYNHIQRAFKQGGSNYVQWAAHLAIGFKTGIPWIMCKQTDAPDPVVSYQIRFVTNSVF